MTTSNPKINSVLSRFEEAVEKSHEAGLCNAMYLSNVAKVKLAPVESAVKVKTNRVGAIGKNTVLGQKLSSMPDVSRKMIPKNTVSAICSGSAGTLTTVSTSNSGENYCLSHEYDSDESSESSVDVFDLEPQRNHPSSRHDSRRGNFHESRSFERKSPRKSKSCDNIVSNDDQRKSPRRTKSSEDLSSEFKHRQYSSRGLKDGGNSQHSSGSSSHESREHRRTGRRKSGDGSSTDMKDTQSKSTKSERQSRKDRDTEGSSDMRRGGDRSPGPDYHRGNRGDRSPMRSPEADYKKGSRGDRSPGPDYHRGNRRDRSPMRSPEEDYKKGSRGDRSPIPSSRLPLSNRSPTKASRGDLARNKSMPATALSSKHRPKVNRNPSTDRIDQFPDEFDEFDSTFEDNSGEFFTVNFVAGNQKQLTPIRPTESRRTRKHASIRSPDPNESGLIQFDYEDDNDFDDNEDYRRSHQTIENNFGDKPRRAVGRRQSTGYTRKLEGQKISKSTRRSVDC